MCWETSCVSTCVPVKTRFFSPVFQAKDLGSGRDTQTSRKIDLTYFGRPPLCIFYGCRYIMGIECWLAALQATPLPPAGSGLVDFSTEVRKRRDNDEPDVRELRRAIIRARGLRSPSPNFWFGAQDTSNQAT